MLFVLPPRQATGVSMARGDGRDLVIVQKFDKFTIRFELVKVAYLVLFVQGGLRIRRHVRGGLLEGVVPCL